MSGFLDMSSEIACDENGGSEVLEDFDEEIRGIINEMGYNIDEQELRELEKDLRFLEENADVAEQQIFSCLLNRFDSFLTDPEQSIQQISNLHQPETIKSKTGIAQELDDFITHGYERLQEVYEDIKRYESLLEEKNAPKDDADTSKEMAVHDDDDVLSAAGPSSNNPPQQQANDKENGQARQPSKKKKDRAQLSSREENRLINEFLRANALRPTKCPEPGRLPFKHDQQLKLEHYRQEWAKHPPPGEQKRMALRWRIREVLLRRDIPCLRLVQDSDVDLAEKTDENEQKQQQPTKKIQTKFQAHQWKP